MAEDLLKHLEQLEAFGSRFDRQAGVPEPDVDWNILPEEHGDDWDAARAFLENLGAMPEVVYPRGARSLEEWARGVKPSVRFFTIDGHRLEEALCRLPSVDVLLDVLREGVSCGAFTVVGDRVLINLPAQEAGGSPSTFEITDVVKRAGAALKAREAASVLQHVAPAGGTAARAAGRGGGFPGLVQVKRQPRRPPPVVREGPRDDADTVRKRIREFVRRHPVVATMEELGEDTVFVVKGGPVRLADGTYLPLEVVEEEARHTLEEQMKRRGRVPRSTVYARVEDLEPVPVPDTYLSAVEAEEGLDETDIPSAARIELAYRLMKGIQLHTDEGEPLDVGTRARFERLLGHGFANVKLHTGPAAKWIAESLSARAVTAGEHIFIPRERLQEGDRGQQTLAHELVHVKQQAEHGQDRPRAELEAEAAAAETAVGAVPDMRWASTVVPRAPRPGRPAPQGVFMAERDTGTEATTVRRGRRPIDLRSEEVLEKLEARIRESEEREKEEARDRVF